MVLQPFIVVHNAQLTAAHSAHPQRLLLVVPWGKLGFEIGHCNSILLTALRIRNGVMNGAGTNVLIDVHALAIGSSAYNQSTCRSGCAGLLLHRCVDNTSLDLPWHSQPRVLQLRPLCLHLSTLLLLTICRQLPQLAIAPVRMCWHQYQQGAICQHLG